MFSIKILGFLFLMVGASGASGWFSKGGLAQLNQLGKNKNSPSHQEIMTGPFKGNLSCCLCDGGMLQPYVGGNSCQVMNGVGERKNCRQIKILGNQCSFFSVKQHSTGFHCEKHPLLRVMENGVELQLEAPERMMSPCDLNVASSFSFQAIPAPAEPKAEVVNSGGFELRKLLDL